MPEESTVAVRNIYLAIPRWLGRGIQNLQVSCSNHSFVLWLTQSFVLPRSIKWLRSIPGDYVIPYYGFAGLRQKIGTIKKDCKVFLFLLFANFLTSRERSYVKSVSPFCFIYCLLFLLVKQSIHVVAYTIFKLLSFRKESSNFIIRKQ